MALISFKVLRTVYEADDSGKLVPFFPGDWVPIGKHRARELIETGQIELTDTEEARQVLAGDLENCGIVVRGDSQVAVGICEKYSLEAVGEPIRLEFERTLIWHSHLRLLPRQVALGFVRIEKQEGYDSWEMAAMLRGHDLLASQYGDAEERGKTREAIGDDRLPVYETGALWIRRTVATEKFLEAWVKELDQDADPEHAFLRALYQNRVLLCTLPARWLSAWGTR